MRMSEIYVATVMLLYGGSILAAYFCKISREQHSKNLEKLTPRRSQESAFAVIFDREV